MRHCGIEAGVDSCTVRVAIMGGELAGHLRTKRKTKKGTNEPPFNRIKHMKNGTAVVVDFACVLSGLIYTPQTAAVQLCRPPQSAVHVQTGLET